MRNKTTIIVLLALLLIFSCTSEQINQINKESKISKILKEVEVFPVELSGEVSKRNSEISGLCWFGKKLIILPQYPNKFGGIYGKLFFIEMEEIENYLSVKNHSPILPKEIQINIEGIEDYFSLGSGFEAVTFNKNTAYFTIESLNFGNTIST